MAKKTFRGRDRRILKKALLCIKLIEERDGIAQNTSKKSSKISTRTLMLDEGSYPAPLTAAALALSVRFTALLAMTG